MKVDDIMIKYINYNPEQATNCIIRTFSLVFGLNCEEIEKQLKFLASKMNKNDYTDVEVFEKYLENNNFEKNSVNNNLCIKDLDLSNGTYCIFCTDKKDFYHMVAVHNNTLYDKKESTIDLYPISIYKATNLVWKFNSDEEVQKKF